MKKILKIIFSRLVIVGLLVLLQIALIIILTLRLSSYFAYFYIVLLLLSVISILYLMGKNVNPSYKLSWAILIMSFPTVGGLFYIIAGKRRLGKKFGGRLENIARITEPYLKQEEGIIEEIESSNQYAANQVRYINDYGKYPIYKNTRTQYFSPGEMFFEDLLKELREAKYFIFMEYFIIHEGKMWNTILDILEEKVKQGVEVRVIYDDIGCVQTLPYKYEELLKRKGIKCQVFNPLAPVLNMLLNNRDHRKMTVIDGYIGYMGGINLADEYINEVVRFGHWKDAAIKIEGEAVWNLSMMFLQVWGLNSDKKENYIDYKPHIYHPETFESDGYVQPYGDSPLDNETVGENVYLNLFHQAKKYIYINTPYFVVDNEVMTALVLAAKSGVDVRIVTPHIEDKWYVHILTRSNYKQLIEAGIKVYEYTPGFIHSKTVVVDDVIAIVGSINLDYRSLYLHFECGTWLYKTQSVLEVKEDFLKTLKVCMPISLEDCNKVNLKTKLLRSILRIFAPLM